jgi:LysR family transcriptional regulator, chromosome initiation inhibitor
MLDYRAIAALHAVIETQGFETAAHKLFITQSAVSQRIAALEKYYGKPVLVRSQPYLPTELGKLLIGHFKKTRLLEDSLHAELSLEIQASKISIAISRDSLETWFVKVLAQLKALSPFQLEIITDDQEVTLDYLKKGLVCACASTEAQPITGCQAELLGFFDYVLVASPTFIKKHFKNKKPTEKNLLETPALIFDNKDYLHAQYLKKYFNLANVNFNHHVIPSVAGFRQFALKGYAYALIPEIDIVNELKQKKLINLFPDKVWQMPLYWHSWALENKTKQAFDDLVLKTARSILRNK